MHGGKAPGALAGSHSRWCSATSEVLDPPLTAINPFTTSAVKLENFEKRVDQLMTRTIPVEHARASARSDFPSGTAKRDLCSDVITYISQKLFSFRHARFGQFGTLFSAFSPCLS